MLFIDALVRFSTFGLLLGLMVLTLRDVKHSVSAYLLVALCISLMAMMISWSPAELGLPRGTRLAIRFIDMPNTVLAWLFIKSIMDDRFRLDLMHISAAGLFCVGYAVILFNSYTESTIAEPWLGAVVNLYALGLFIHLGWSILRDWRQDLIEDRRRARLAFVLLTTALVSFLILTELLLSDFSRQTLTIMKVGVTLFLVLFGYLWFLEVKPNHVAFRQEQRIDERGAFTEKELSLLNTLNEQMQEKEVWAQAGLTIGTLAAEIGVGEHTLRKFINSRLGYSNFSKYLQTFRLERAKALLSDPKHSETQISAIAYECGFNSISTFNRTFKESEGVSPKTFREQAR